MRNKWFSYERKIGIHLGREKCRERKKMSEMPLQILSILSWAFSPEPFRISTRFFACEVILTRPTKRPNELSLLPQRMGGYVVVHFGIFQGLLIIQRERVKFFKTCMM
jgi:hypothetical protein